MTLGRIFYILVFSLISTTFLGQYSQEKSLSHGGGQYTPHASPQKVIVKSDGSYFFNGLDKGEYRGAPYQHASYFNLNEGLGYLGDLVDYPSEPTFSGPSPYYFPKDMQATSDNGVLLYMHSDSLHPTYFNENQYRQPTLIKLDSTGNEMWRKRYPDFRGSNSWSYNTVRSLLAVAGGYLVVNEWPIRDFTAPNEPSYGEQDLWLMKVDSEGNQLWVKHFGGSGNEQLLAAVEHENGNVGFLLKSNSTDYDLVDKSDIKATGWYLELDADGEILVNQVFISNLLPGVDSNLVTNLKGMLVESPTELLLYGYQSWNYQSPDGFHYHDSLPEWKKSTNDAFLAKYSLTSNVFEIVKYFGGTASEEFNTGQKLTTGNYAFGGITASKDGDLSNESYTGADAWLTILKEDRRTIEQNVLLDKNGEVERIHALAETKEGDIICLASINYIYKTVYWVLKLSKNITGLYEVSERKPLLNAYPNPNSTGVLQTNIEGDFELLDTLGRIIATYKNSSSLDVSMINTGTYFLRHSSGASKKVIIK